MNRCRLVGLTLAACLTVLPVLRGEDREKTPKKFMVYFGTYTGGKSKGIYRSELDLATGKLSEPKLAGKAVNPSFLAIHPGGKLLYRSFTRQRDAGAPRGILRARSVFVPIVTQRTCSGKFRAGKRRSSRRCRRCLFLLLLFLLFGEQR